jgi:hypothetical protein
MGLTNRFAAKAKQWLRKSRRSVGRVRRIEREDLEILQPRARRAGRRKSIVQGRSITTTTHPSIAIRTGRL